MKAPITLSMKTWFYMTLVGCIFVPTIIFVAEMPYSYAWFYNRIYGSELQRECGFTASFINYPWQCNGSTYRDEELTITSVQPGGLFDCAGFRAGDIITGFQHGAYSQFYPTLNYQRGKGPFTIRVLAASDWSKHDASKVRVITLTIPSKRN